jgi:hypothetical protein
MKKLVKRGNTRTLIAACIVCAIGISSVTAYLAYAQQAKQQEKQSAIEEKKTQTGSKLSKQIGIKVGKRTRGAKDQADAIRTEQTTLKRKQEAAKKEEAAKNRSYTLGGTIRICSATQVLQLQGKYDDDNRGLAEGDDNTYVLFVLDTPQTLAIWDGSHSNPDREGEASMICLQSYGADAGEWTAYSGSHVTMQFMANNLMWPSSVTPPLNQPTGTGTVVS